LAPKDKIVYRFLVRRGDTIEGYIAYTQAGRADPIIVTDAVILSREAGRAMLGLLAGYQSVIDQMVWTGSVLDPFVYLLDENLTAGTKSRVGMRTSYDWMLRIVDVAGALVARGYPMRISAELEIQVVDPILPANDGVYRLRVADGRAAVLPGGSGRITIGIRELAALYTGFQSPSELRALGLIDGPDADLALLGAIFSGPQPWLADMF
jgi:predicted acetyltransferase